jgi:hypothetical protein
MSGVPEPVSRTVDWWFRDRSTGRLVVGQFPNWPLWLWLAAVAVGAVFHPDGAPGTLLSVLQAGALVVWAVMEVGWGVNPWRRLLGTVVLVWQVASVVGRLG